MMLERLIVLVAGYRWLYEVPKILHRDISVNNLMLRKEEGNVYAVLNDLDRAVYADVQGQLSKEGTGTWPFMALDLLLRPPKTVHLYRHDLESLFYILVWITSRFHKGKEIEDPPLESWEDVNVKLVRASKISFLLGHGEYKPTGEFESLGELIDDMGRMFGVGYMTRNYHRGQDPHFATDTLGGRVTFDSFQTILDSDLA